LGEQDICKEALFSERRWAYEPAEEMVLTIPTQTRSRLEGWWEEREELVNEQKIIREKILEYYQSSKTNYKTTPFF